MNANHDAATCPAGERCPLGAESIIGQAQAPWWASKIERWGLATVFALAGLGMAGYLVKSDRDDRREEKAALVQAIKDQSAALTGLAVEVRDTRNEIRVLGERGHRAPGGLP